MDNTLYQTVGSYLGIPISIVVILIVFTVRFWFPRLIHFFSEKGLIKFKVELETEKEKQLAEFGKSITGFNKYFNKKYDVYPILYSELLKVQGQINAWGHSPLIPDFNKFTESNLIEYLSLFHFSEPDKKDLISKLKNDHLNAQDF